ncbi:hypothetical protein [Salipiger mucosus]|uniref:Sulfotransferase domain-containing protein n=1 Tax=Salipiger mucosus DSM 16094 TaxID=1123237 RepID=S9RIZ9_9RHOB|nr:hypothetical protein [Salipiger mucosus]EPX78080.1 hypothetical protein Salmuc_03402 [Salipiger mucosus DSM 16094]
MERHIITAGYGRAGTTLFYNMLRHTLKGGFELPEKEVPAMQWIDKPGNFCTKRPFDIFEIPNILQKNAGRKRVDLIISLRDPRDMLVSFHKSVPDDYFVSADYCYFSPKGRTPTKTAPGIIPTQDAIAKIATSGLFPNGVFLLKYEDLVANPENIKEKLSAGLDLEFEGNFSDFHTQAIPEDLSRALNGVRPVQKEEIPKWKKPEHRERIIEQFTSFPELHDILIALNYEKDESWFEEFKAREVQQEQPEARSS